MNQQSPTIPLALQAAVEHHQAGRLQQAETIYKQILAAEPDHADANHLLGVLAMQAGQHEFAVQLISKAINKNPFQPSYYNNLGNAYKGLDNLQEAADAFKRALSYNPGYAEAHNNLGVILKEMDELEEAAAAFRQALSINPGYAEALYNLGNTLQESGDIDAAVNCYQKSLAKNPHNAEVLYNLGNGLLKQKKPDEAESALRESISINPAYAEPHNLLGNIKRRQGKTDEAIALFQRALARNPDFAEAHFNLGNALKDQERMAEALSSYQKALALKPDFPEALNEMGRALYFLGRIDKAQAIYRKSLILDPDNAVTYSHIGLAYCSQAKIEEAVANFRKALTIKPDFTQNHSNLLMVLNYMPGLSQEDIYKESLHWDKQQAKEFLRTDTLYENIPDSNRKLKIGYVSPDFRSHSVAYFIESIITALNRENVEVYCYANVIKPDTVTERLQAKADHWSSIVGKEDEDIAAEIRKDEIDILVDLAGHTANNSLLVFARRPAPVQVTWLGYPNTTGMRAMDYRLTDAIADPVGKADELHSETLIRLQHGFLCYRPEESAPAVAQSPCLEKQHITFGSFNNAAKINGAAIKCWAEILRSVEKSHLLLKSMFLADKEIKARFIDMFEKEGITRDRLEMHDRLPNKKDHLAFYSKVDIGLDTFPYNGTTTTCESLWMGVPVVAILGDRHCARVGASILHHAGLPELVATSLEEYVKIAVSLAHNPERLQEMRRTLRDKMQHSQLMDKDLFTGTLEGAYRKMWSAWCEKRKPAISNVV